MNYNNNNTKKNTLKGGKKIGKGTSACVISPAISCTNKKTYNKISKIYESKSLTKDYHLLNKKLKAIDPNNDYLIHYYKYCVLKHSDVIKRRFGDIKYTSPSKDKLDNTLFDDFQCILNKKNSYVNIIEEYNGIALNELIKVRHFSKNQLLVIIKELMKGLKLLHDNNIYHKDIKLDNILISNGIHPKYIDFLYSKDMTKYKPYKLYMNGNYNYSISIDQLVLMNLYYYKYVKKEKINKKNANNIMNLIMSQYNNVVLDINKNYFSYNKDIEIKLKNHTDINITKQSIKKDNKLLILYVIYLLDMYYNESEFMEKYINEYVYKNDIFALGIVIKLLILNYDKSELSKNKDIINLLNHMIDLDIKKRFTIDECINYCKKKMIFK